MPRNSYDINQFPDGRSAPPLYNVLTKTADYTILESDHGTIIDNLGATAAVILTLPALANIPDGWWVRAFNATLTQDLTVASNGSLDNIVVLNDIAADSVKWGTANERAGGGFEFVKRGTKWFCFLMAHETQTPTIA
jgi:hypothetical protein